uniref:Uncharacterized protein n=1 Tax=Pseudodiaptomus poplesia TaxID=213370 RepID=A0A1S6GL98_9MAXI|nr:hypothetical protein [Pseudodiaptomus poplesia]
MQDKFRLFPVMVALFLVTKDVVGLAYLDQHFTASNKKWRLLRTFLLWDRENSPQIPPSTSNEEMESNNQ